VTELSPDSIASWHRRICPVTDWLLISGDLPSRPVDAYKKLHEWIEAGVTDIVDVRGEWSDARLVERIAPHIRYHYLGTHDDGTEQDDEWFRSGIAALQIAQQNVNSVMMVHCHMGVNRGPSMAFAFLLEQGWDPLEALTAIRRARPIAGIIYAPDAVRALTPELTARGLDVTHVTEQVEQWFHSNDIDVATIIRRIRIASN
jgi:protein-tyrosine phosphatase